VTSAEFPSPSADFIVTREYRRFAEFCDACREARYIGLCYGLPGVGKTVSARQYARWSQLESLMGGPPPYRHTPTPPRDSGPWQTVLYTPGVTNTPRTVDQAVRNLWGTVDGLGARATWYGHPNAMVMSQPPDLLVVDEAHWGKNLPFVTRLDRVRGLPNPTECQRATDLFLKTQWLLEQLNFWTNNRDVKQLVRVRGGPLRSALGGMDAVPTGVRGIFHEVGMLGLEYPPGPKVG